MFTTLAIMAALLGASSFGFGILPLSFAFSSQCQVLRYNYKLNSGGKSLENHLERLSALGTGLLLGAALGVIIPECVLHLFCARFEYKIYVHRGIEAVVSDKPSTAFPSSKIAISLLAGFVFMLVIEQLVSPGAHSHSFSDDLHLHTVKEVEHNNSSEVEFDAELGDLEREQGTGRPGYRQVAVPAPEDHRAARARAYPLTFGLVVHGLADGLALGVSSLSNIEPGGSSNLSFIVFLALIIHKGTVLSTKYIHVVLTINVSTNVIGSDHFSPCNHASPGRMQKAPCDL